MKMQRVRLMRLLEQMQDPEEDVAQMRGRVMLAGTAMEQGSEVLSWLGAKDKAPIPLWPNLFEIMLDQRPCLTPHDLIEAVSTGYLRFRDHAAKNVDDPALISNPADTTKVIALMIMFVMTAARTNPQRIRRSRSIERSLYLDEDISSVDFNMMDLFSDEPMMGLVLPQLSEGSREFIEVCLDLLKQRKPDSQFESPFNMSEIAKKLGIARGTAYRRRDEAISEVQNIYRRPVEDEINYSNTGRPNSVIVQRTG